MPLSEKEPAKNLLSPTEIARIKARDKRLLATLERAMEILNGCKWNFEVAEIRLRMTYERSGLPNLNFEFSAFLSALFHERRKRAVRHN